MPPWRGLLDEGPGLPWVSSKAWQRPTLLSCPQKRGWALLPWSCRKAQGWGGGPQGATTLGASDKVSMMYPHFLRVKTHSQSCSGSGHGALCLGILPMLKYVMQRMWLPFCLIQKQQKWISALNHLFHQHRTYLK